MPFATAVYCLVDKRRREANAIACHHFWVQHEVGVPLDGVPRPRRKSDQQESLLVDKEGMTWIISNEWYAKAGALKTTHDG